MKNLIVLICVFSLSNSFSQETLTLERASDNIQDIINHKLNKKPNVFIANIETIDSIIKLTKKKYKIIYFFSDRCHSCVETFPKLLKFINENSNRFELLPIIGHRNKEIPHFVGYLQKNKFFQPVYLLNMGKYGSKKNPFKRIDQLTRTLCKECDYKRMGFSSFFVFDEKHKIVAHNNWDFNWSDQIKQLIQLVK